MDLNTFKLNLKSQNLGGVYIFAGEEDYLVRYYLRALREAVGIDSAFAIFNNPVYDGSEVDFAAIAEDMKSPPMMSDFKLIEWRHADFSSMREDDFLALESIVEQAKDYPYSVVAFTAVGGGLDFGTPKRPSAFVKRFDSKLNLLRFEKSSENQLYSWLKKHFDSHGITVNLETVKALVFRSGHSMDVLAAEVEKLSALALMRGKKFVTAEDVEEVASSTLECDTFALSNAILERNKPNAFLALEEMKLRRVDPMMAMGMISKTYGELLAVSFLLAEGRGADGINEVMKMNEYRLKINIAAAKRYGHERLAAIVDALTRTDAGSKYGGVTGYCAVELFIAQNL